MIEEEIAQIERKLHDLAEQLGYVEYSETDGWRTKKESAEAWKRMMDNLDKLKSI